MRADERSGAPRVDAGCGSIQSEQKRDSTAHHAGHVAGDHARVDGVVAVRQHVTHEVLRANAHVNAHAIISPVPTKAGILGCVCSRSRPGDVERRWRIYIVPSRVPRAGREGGRDVLLGNRRCSLCLLYTSPSPRDATLSRMPSSA